ncbi:MAG: hypothetical protein ACI4DP_11535 [Candidatus Ornithomonoglobus sp.]
MFINEVLRKVRKYYPSEYEPEEMYGWCNEVSSKLSIEERQVYKRKNLPIAKDGTVLLPEGVDILHVERMIAGGFELEKKDYRNYGLVTIQRGGRTAIVIPEKQRSSHIVSVIYLEPYIPIRMVKYSGKIHALTGDETAIGIGTDNEFIPGDWLKITIGENKYKNIPVMDITHSTNPDGLCLLITPEDALSEIITQTPADGIITRTITEKTVCDAPYDAMYVDYLLMKICEYQRDWTAYAQYKQRYESLYDDYRKFVEERKPAKDTGWKNWW